MDCGLIIRRPVCSLRKIYSRNYVQFDATGKIESMLGFAVIFKRKIHATSLQDYLIKTLTKARILFLGTLGTYEESVRRDFCIHPDDAL
jgi:hypothetical protein